MAGIAAGDGSQAGDTSKFECTGDNTFIGVAPRADLVIAKTNFNSDATVAGVRHIFQFAAAQTPAKVAVVNLSLGGQDGAHDGTEQEERDLDASLMDAATPPAPIPGRVIIKSAGNNRDDGIHASGRVPATGTVTFQFVVPRDDKNRDFFELWYTGPGAIGFHADLSAGRAHRQRGCWSSHPERTVTGANYSEPLGVRKFDAE